MMIAVSGPIVSDFRLAFIWHQVLVNAGRYTCSIADSYQEHFGTPGGELGPPWPKHGEQGFWNRYLEGTSLKRLSPSVAWRALVPLRLSGPLQLDGPMTESRVSCEGLIYPWGITLVISLTSAHPQNLTDLAQQVVQLRHELDFPTTRKSATRPLTLTRTAEHGLDELRNRFGADTNPGTAPDPFSVFSVTQAAGSPMDFDPSREEVSRLLYAASSFSKTWEHDEAPAVNDCRVAGRSNAPPSHVVYGSRRARAIWSPVSFLNPGGSTIGCHHRNLLLASAQTEALASYAAATASEIDSGTYLLSQPRAIAQRAVGLLGRMYGGVRNTYRSGSIQVQIEQNGWTTAIDAVRHELGLTPLTRPSGTP